MLMGLPLMVITVSGTGSSSLFRYTSWYQNMKSSAVKGWPSLHFIPRRSWSVVTLPSGLTSQRARDVRDDLGARVVPVEQLVVLGDPVAVGGVEGAREAAAPRPAVLPDLAQRLDDEGILADALLDRRQLARLHELGELRAPP